MRVECNSSRRVSSVLSSSYIQLRRSLVELSEVEAIALKFDVFGVYFAILDGHANSGNAEGVIYLLLRVHKNTMCAWVGVRPMFECGNADGCSEARIHVQLRHRTARTRAT